jgi:hypothetical protein
VAVDALIAFLSAPEESGRHGERIAQLALLDRVLVHNSEGTP